MEIFFYLYIQRTNIGFFSSLLFSNEHTHLFTLALFFPLMFALHKLTKKIFSRKLNYNTFQIFIDYK